MEMHAHVFRFGSEWWSTWSSSTLEHHAAYAAGPVRARGDDTCRSVSYRAARARTCSGSGSYYIQILYSKILIILMMMIKQGLWSRG